MALLCFRNYYWPRRIRMRNHLQLEKKVRENVSIFFKEVKTFNYFVHVLTSQTVDSKCLIFWQTETPTSWGYNTWKIVQFKIPSIKSTFLKLFERNKGTCVAIIFSKTIQFSFLKFLRETNVCTHRLLIALFFHSLSTMPNNRIK